MEDRSSPNLLTLFLSEGLTGLLRANIAPEALIAWFQDPATQSALASLHAIADSAATLRLAHARFTAIQTLDQLCTTAPSQKDRRLAATTIHRAANSLPAAGRAEAGLAKSRTTSTTSAHLPLPEQGGRGVATRFTNDPLPAVPTAQSANIPSASAPLLPNRKSEIENRKCPDPLSAAARAGMGLTEVPTSPAGTPPNPKSKIRNRKLPLPLPELSVLDYFKTPTIDLSDFRFEMSPSASSSSPSRPP
jgi:hypothetical protein